MTRLVAAGVVVLAASGCGGTAPPEIPAGADGTADVVLVRGREVYDARCKSCHGVSGGGGTGTSLRDVAERYPDVADQVAVVAEGRNAMPAFGETLSAADLEAVVRYTREVLSGGP